MLSGVSILCCWQWRIYIVKFCMHAPHPIFFILMWVLAHFGKIIGWRSACGLPPPLGNPGSVAGWLFTKTLLASFLYAPWLYSDWIARTTSSVTICTSSLLGNAVHYHRRHPRCEEKICFIRIIAFGDQDFFIQFRKVIDPATHRKCFTFET